LRVLHPLLGRGGREQNPKMFASQEKKKDGLTRGERSSLVVWPPPQGEQLLGGEIARVGRGKGIRVFNQEGIVRVGERRVGEKERRKRGENPIEDTHKPM